MAKLLKTNLKKERTERLTVLSGDVTAYNGPAFVNHILPANPTLNQALKALDDGGGPNGGVDIGESFSYLGYYLSEQTVTYDISTIVFPGAFWITIDSTPKFVGESIADSTAFLAALNALLLGAWTLDGNILTVIGFHLYGEINPISASGSASSSLIVDTTSPVDMMNIYGSTAFDISLENTLVGNTDLIAKIAALNFRFLCWPTGAVINWTHYISGTGDGWNSLEADATDRGKDYTIVQGGDLYNGGVPWGRDFMVEFIYLINQLNALNPGSIEEVVVGVNIAFPLIPFSNDTINWAGVDYDALKDEIALAVTKVATTTATIKAFEFGMELITNSFEDLFINTGGAETTKAQVLKKLLTNKILTGVVLGVPQYTDSIIEYVKDLLPSALISVDGRLWDDTTSHDSDWVGVLTAIDGVDCIRDYYQFKDAEATSYAAVRAKVADRTDFWAYLEDPDHNGKKVFISQLTVKATSIVRNTVANGLLIAEMYLQMTSDNLDHDDKLIGMTHMNIKQLFDINDGYALKVHYAFVKQLGEFFHNTQKKITITGSSSLINTNLVMLAIKVGSEIRIAVLNPTAEDITVEALNIDGEVIAANNFSVDQNYSDDPLEPLALTATHVVESELHFRPYSFSIIKTTPVVVDAVETMQGMFGTALDNVGYYYTSLYSNATFMTLMGTVGFQHGLFSSGAQDRWIHYVSKRGGFDLLPNNEVLSTVSPNVGMRANTNEMYHYTGSVDDAVDLHESYNATGQDFFARFKAYCTAQNIAMVVFTANISHGTTAELGQFLTELETLGIPYKVRYGNEMSSGNSDAVTPGTTMSSAEYIALVTTFDTYVQANFPNALRVINAARVGDDGLWDNDAVAALAISREIPEFSQYFWLNHHGGNEPVDNEELNIDDYFDVALENAIYSEVAGNYSLYGEILPRLLTYYNQFYPVRMHIGQYGCSLQRTGYFVNTMGHGVAIANMMFEFWKFNYTHNNFISSATFLMNESAVDEQGAQDSLFSIDAAWKSTAGGHTFIKRIQGVIYELFKPLSTFDEGYPEFVPVTITNAPSKFDIVSFVVDDEVYLWIYNFASATEIQSIVVDGNTLLSNVDRTGAYSTKLYGSIGTSPAYNYFKDFTVENPGFAPVNILRINNLNRSSANIPIEQYSVAKIKLTGITTASAITINITPLP